MVRDLAFTDLDLDGNEARRGFLGLLRVGWLAGWRVGRSFLGYRVDWTEFGLVGWV